MGRIYTTAHGKQIDMDRLRVANEETIAVGNMKVNARGDKLGTGGEVAQTRNQIQDNYNKLYTPVPQESPAENIKVATSSGANVRSGAPIEESAPTIAETPEPAVPNLRSQLAQSIASPTVVKQEPIKDPRKPTGPARI